MRDFVLRYSLDQQRIISIRYKKEEKIELRKIKVLKIHEEDIKAYCYLRHGVRSFKINNILSAIM